tara:strand:- start:253 stop:432 length:180 start_codon:yes stop_codon:yes gene_type:complete
MLINPAALQAMFEFQLQGRTVAHEYERALEGSRVGHFPNAKEFAWKFQDCRKGRWPTRN